MKKILTLVLALVLGATVMASALGDGIVPPVSITLTQSSQTVEPGVWAQIDFYVGTGEAVTTPLIAWGDGSQVISATCAGWINGGASCVAWYAFHLYPYASGSYHGTVSACDSVLGSGVNCNTVGFTITVSDPPASAGGGRPPLQM